MDLDHQQAHPVDAAVAAHTSQALALRIAGASYRRIADVMGISKSAAHKYVTTALREIQSENAEDATELRRLELERLDALALRLWPRDAAATLTPRVADSIVRIMERRAKLVGLDAPVDTRLGGLPGAPIVTSHELDLTRLTVDEVRTLLDLRAKAEVVADDPLPPT